MKRVFSLLYIACIFCSVVLSGCSSASKSSPDEMSSFPTVVEGQETVTSVPIWEMAKQSVRNVYRDKKNGLSFTLPADWEAMQYDESGDSLLITAPFDDAPVMLYAGYDIWGSQTAANKVDLSRVEFSNDLLTEELIEDLVGGEIDGLTRIEFNDCEYYYGIVNGFADDINSSVMWCRLENGWFDLFMFCDTKDSLYYGAFEDLIFSVVYDRHFDDEEMDVPEVYLTGVWSDKPFKRNGCTSYPFVLDTPIKNCKGFTVEYSVSDVTDGKMKSDAKFQIFYQTADGTWNKGETFKLGDDGSTSIEQTISKPVTVTQVTVHCMNSGNFSWKSYLSVKSPVF